VLDAHVTFKRELRGGDEVDVTCAFSWGGRKTYDILQDFTRADGALAAVLTSKAGFLDLAPCPDGAHAAPAGIPQVR
jgi:acyl-CoA thioester hydrolase